MRTYSRWVESLGRRETWPETVERFLSFLAEERGEKIPAKVMRKIRARILAFEVMPSMRALWAAGDAARADNTTMYNCAFQRTASIRAFAESLYILMCGTGYGFRVRALDVAELPPIPAQILATDRIVEVEDAKDGWANSVKELVLSLYAGQDPTISYNKVRPAGSRLKTMGGRASGPAPLATLHQFIKDTFYAARGRKLSTLEAHDFECQIAEIVVVGGVRRSSEMSLSDLFDALMRDAKSGEFPVRRWMSNNSAIYYEKPSMIEFMKEWTALAASGRGERGIFNLEGARRQAPARRKRELIEGTNPCGEILLRDQQFCNLSEVVARDTDTIDDILDKIETATWLGAIQSTFTYFPYLDPKWKENCEEERLLGVSITGQMDVPRLFTKEALEAYKARAIKTAKKASATLGINMPAAITCVKPSGTVSQLVDSSSGIHPRFAKYYIRRYRINATDPLLRMIRDQGMSLSPENGQGKKDWIKANKIFEETKDIIKARSTCSIYDPAGWSKDKVNTWVVGFPMRAPDDAYTVDIVSAIAQLEWYKKVQTHWCEHNASVTVYVKEDEWLAVGDWVYENWDIINGISFLPVEGGEYEQTPYEEISEELYEAMVKAFKKIDYSQLSRYELEDTSQGSKEYACSGAQGCEM
jgi:ribonucleoside-diphosphate reductase alpha chain